MIVRKEIILNNQKIPYTFRKSRRSRCMRLTIKTDATLVVSVPWLLSRKKAEDFIRQKADWILGKLEYFKNKKTNLPSATRKDYLQYKKLAREIAQKKLEYFNQYYNFKIGKISIRNQKTRWGSCSRSGNLNFSYRIIYLSENLCDYIIVHELCHLGEFNHSKNFWDLVQKTVPEYKKIRKEIKKM
ncbi:MAG: metal-dependent hydrolase [Candidatus Moranbacteria bacterium CG23_combo_of_CG06-09_8_20_14_all_35_22]|nr:MAG: metal-dependent hydrolase [Candidatus Moranbacteria bacterium CG23_combo_of_CG06-09_8_20_14_all_35_22]